MTILTTGTVAEHTGDGSTVAFSFPNKFYDEDTLVVTVDDVTQVIVTDYTVSGEGAANGGTVTFVVAPADGADINISRLLDVVQLWDADNQKAYFLENIEETIDKLIMIIQQQQVTIEDLEDLLL